MKNDGREDAPFVLRRRRAGRRGAPYLAEARSSTPPAPTPPEPARRRRPAGDRRARRADRIFYGIPDVLGADAPATPAARAGRRQRPLRLQRAARPGRAGATEPGTQIIWAIRRGAPGRMFGGGADDELPGARRARRAVATLVETAPSSSWPASRPRGVAERDGRLVSPTASASSWPTRSSPRPASARTSRCCASCAWSSTRVEAARALAPLIDPNVHSCGTVPPHGATSSRTPKPASTSSA